MCQTDTINESGKRNDSGSQIWDSQMFSEKPNRGNDEFPAPYTLRSIHEI